MEFDLQVCNKKVFLQWMEGVQSIKRMSQLISRSNISCIRQEAYIASRLQSFTAYQAPQLCASEPSFSAVSVSQCLAIIPPQADTNPPSLLMHGTAQAWDYGHRRCRICDCVSDSPLMQLKELSNSCSVLGHRWELAPRCHGSDKCQTMIMEGKKQIEETVYDVSACLNQGQLMFAPQVLLHLYPFLDAHTSKDDTNPLMNIYYCLG